jgi:uncharacterized protein
MLKIFADWVTYKILSLEAGTHAADAVNFFIYDTLKIFLLLMGIIFIVSLIRSFLPPQKIKKILSHEKPYISNILAALLGTITPFCTCSAIPLFLGFIEAGVPLGATFSFLVASPMVNEVALALLFGMFGWKIALIYIASGLVIAILSGIIIGKLKVEELIEDMARGKNAENQLPSDVSWKQRFRFAKRYTFRIVKKVWIYIIVGVGIGAWIHGYVPTDLLAEYASLDKWYAVPLAVAIGIPLYSNAAGIIPLVGVLTEKGVAIGTALAFMMAVTGLSLPEFLILKKVMKVKLILIFAGIVGAGIIFTGYLFNAVLKQY